MLLKRNQVETAIGRVLEPGSAKPSSELRTRMKRLLETDRALGRSKRSADPGRAHFAFYSEDAPGRGVEIWFSGYEAFALLTSLRLMQHGWPQGFAVAVLRHVRLDLEKHHDQVLREDPAVLFDQQQIRAQAKPGQIAVDNTNPLFLVIISRDLQNRSGPVSVGVCRGIEALWAFVRAQKVAPGEGWSTFELVNSAYALSRALAKTKPSKRGPGNR